MDYDIELLTNVINYNRERYLAFKHNTTFRINPEYEKILNARYQKVSRVKKRLLYLLIRFKYVWFVTFTFSDTYINKCDRTKRDLIKSVINTHDFKYILNIDYGKQTMRQHFHCIIATNIDMDLNQYFQNFYQGGFSLSIQCKNGIDDFKRLSKYINKLVNHCLKATTNRQRLVYNFKGYDSFCPDCRTKSIQFDLEYEYLLDLCHPT
jgi:hypothetical protein